MRKKIVAGNWKMNGSNELIAAMLPIIAQNALDLNDLEVIIFPPFAYLDKTQQLLNNTAVKWGAQTLSEYEDGAYTGEISANMLVDFGCEYVLVGHSERRSIYCESNEVVAEKFKQAVSAGLKPILCLGESQQERAQKLTFEVIKKQLIPILNLDSSLDLMQNAVLAYEPVWAIGTGVTATPEQAQEVHAEIRAFLAEYDVNLAENMTILYGGSVKPANAAEIFKMADIDGGLIGGASLDKTQFLEICQCNNYS